MLVSIYLLLPLCVCMCLSFSLLSLTHLSVCVCVCICLCIYLSLPHPLYSLSFSHTLHTHTYTQFFCWHLLKISSCSFRAFILQFPLFTLTHAQSPLNPALRKSALTFSMLFFPCKLDHSTVCFWVRELNRVRFIIGSARGLGFVTKNQHPKKQEIANSQGWTFHSLLEVFVEVS